eukprot:jgi/Botrbrau1/20274/Bobra.31_1s0057.1
MSLRIDAFLLQANPTVSLPHAVLCTRRVERPVQRKWRGAVCLAQPRSPIAARAATQTTVQIEQRTTHDVTHVSDVYPPPVSIVKDCPLQSRAV